VDQAALTALHLRQPGGGRGRRRRHRRPGRLAITIGDQASPATAAELASVGALPGQFGLVALPILGTGSGILALSARSAAALIVTGLLVGGLGTVLDSTAATVTAAVAVLFPPRSWGPWCPTSSSRQSGTPSPAGLSIVLASGTCERFSPEVAGPAARHLGYCDPGRRAITCTAATRDH
jgi:hypothetical protein